MPAAPAMRESLSPEYACLLSALTPGISARLEPLEWDRSRWNHLLGLARWHRLAPALFHQLRSDSSAPVDVMDALRDEYVANASRNLLFTAALERILRALERAGVPVMLLKGAALLETVYTDPALRQMADVDLLVPKTKLDGANAALAAIGYSQMGRVTRDEDTTEWMRRHHHHDPPLIDEHRSVCVELHHHIVKRELSAHFDIGGFWQRSRAAATGPTHVVPAAEDLLLHACIHFTSNRMASSFGALAQLADIAWILERERIESKTFIDTARAYRLENTVFLALFSAHELGLAVPAEPLQALRPPGFDERLGRRLIALRVLRTRAEVPRRSLRKAIAPGRWGLESSWGAARGSWPSLVGAYVRRALRSLRYVRKVIQEPRTVVQDYRLNRQVAALTGRMRDPH